MCGKNKRTIHVCNNLPRINLLNGHQRGVQQKRRRLYTIRAQFDCLCFVAYNNQAPKKLSLSLVS